VFYAGAISLFGSMITILDPGEEPTDADLAQIQAIHDELEEYRAEIAALERRPM
jgi:hypothetical protein